MGPPVAARKGGLATAKRAPAVDDTPSLIDFGTAAAPIAPLQQAAWSATFDDFDWQSTAVAASTVTVAAAPAVDQYANKKAAVLSMYGTAQLPASAQRMCWGSHAHPVGNSNFFAQ